jgi:nicotinamide phosphoribosyltransferase
MRNVISPKPDLEFNNIDDTDSYKLSHFLLYPKKMNKMFSYLEARGGEFETATLFGLQVIVHKYLSKPFTLEQIDSMTEFALLHGEPFNRDGFIHMLERYDGKLPVRIRAIPEGLNIPVSNALMTCESMDDELCAWMVNWLETQLARIWYPSEIATTSREVKKVWAHYLELSSDDPVAEIGFKHHDFGARGVTCREQAGLGGAAHLLSFFGSDTIVGVKTANYYYDCPMAGFSIPATEHSTMTIFGRAGERQAVIDWITKTLVEREVPLGVPKLSACVGDSYDIYNFTKMICEDEIRQLVEGSKGTLVVRPDSGDPLEVLPKLLEIFEAHLPEGSVTENKKGYKVLPSYFRIIWGDGINRRSMKTILKYITDVRWSVSNLAFGSGGGLLQDVNRDTQKFAFKCSEVEINGKSIDVRKDPITDPGKRSKAGRLDVIRLNDGTYETIQLCGDEIAHPDSIMVTVFEVGDILYHTTLDEVRARMML